jgi:alpha-tubulin suppressor-like RCC1 family protein
VPAAAKSDVTAIAAGEAQNLALRSDGSIVAWGNSQTTVPFAARSGVVAIAMGAVHSVALKTNGSVVAWGEYDITSDGAGSGCARRVAFSAPDLSAFSRTLISFRAQLRFHQ